MSRPKRNAHRTRHKVKFGGNEPAKLYIQLGDGPIQKYDVVTSQYTQDWEYMKDTIGFLANDFNPCFHEKFKCNMYGVREFSETDPGTEATTHWKFSPQYVGYYPKDIAPALRKLELPISEWIDDFEASADNHFVTAVQDDVSLINFLIEILETLEGNIKVLLKLKELISTALKRFFDFLKKHPGKHWLAWNFAIKPTIADIIALANSFRSANKRLKWLRARNHLDTKVKYRQGPWKHETSIFVDLDTLQGPRQQPPSAFPLPFPTTRVRCDLNIRVYPTAWAWVRFDIPDWALEDVIGEGLVWSTVVGLMNPFKIIWEAIPFSWLIDWFRSKRNRLLDEIFNFSPLKDAEIHAKGCSFRLGIKGTMYMGDDYSTLVGDFTYQTFVRRPGYPEVDAQPIRVPFRWYNASILASLISQKRRRH